MSQIILGVIALAGVIWLLKSFTKAKPSAMARMLKTGGGIAALLAGVVLTLRGRFDAGLPLIFLGLGLAGWMPGMPASLGGRTTQTPGQVSRVRSAMIEMELNRDTGAMSGRVLAGRFAGRALDQLTLVDCGSLYLETAADPDGRSLLEAYLDRRFPRWREDLDQHADPRAGQRARSTGKMTKEEAHQILGVQPGASADEIRAAHRALMKKLHPDQGGSTYLAARVNEAKDVLLG